MLSRLILCCVICVSTVGCKPAANPGTWDQTRVAEHLKKKHNLEEISLSPGSEGGLSGSGKTKEGETYKFKVTQNSELKKLSWDFESDRGDIGNEVYEFIKAE